MSIATLRFPLLYGPRGCKATSMCFESLQCVDLAQPDLSEEGYDAGN